MNLTKIKDYIGQLNKPITRFTKDINTSSCKKSQHLKYFEKERKIRKNK